jgi:hypothetical protein
VYKIQLILSRLTCYVGGRSEKVELLEKALCLTNQGQFILVDLWLASSWRRLAYHWVCFTLWSVKISLVEWQMVCFLTFSTVIRVLSSVFRPVKLTFLFPGLFFFSPLTQGCLASSCTSKHLINSACLMTNEVLF